MATCAFVEIAAVRCVLVRAPYAAPGDAERERHLKRGFHPAPFFVVETVEGATGIGETYAGVYAPEAVQALVAQFGHDLDGEDPRNAADLWDRLRLSSYYWGRMGLTQGGIELALRDLNGKLVGQPVYRLLGNGRGGQMDTPTTEPPMRERLTRGNLRGVWAAIATPFDEHDRFDAGVLRENMRRLHGAGVHGIYTTDSDGEFYAIELDEYRRVVDAFADEAHRLGIPTQVGVTWSNTPGIVDRLRHAADRGILGAHVGHPFFMPMTPESYRVFWEDVREAVPETFALIHYNTPRVHNYQRGPDYALLQRDVPNLVGTKHVGSDVPEFLTLIGDAPGLSHFTGEHAFTPFAMFGARGVYSWFANFNARYMVDWDDALRAGRWEDAAQRQRRMHAFMRASSVLHENGNLHAVLGKAITACSPFLIPNNWTRRPYLPVRDENVRLFQRIIDDEFADLRWSG